MIRHTWHVHVQIQRVNGVLAKTIVDKVYSVKSQNADTAMARAIRMARSTARRRLTSNTAVTAKVWKVSL